MQDEWVCSSTAQDMYVWLKLIFAKFENFRDIKIIISPFVHILKICIFSKFGGSSSKNKPAAPLRSLKKMSIFYLIGGTHEPENQSILDYSKLVWDITTKISPFLDLMRIQLFTKFGDPCCTQNGFPTKTILNFSRAQQAYFLCYYLQIW